MSICLSFYSCNGFCSWFCKRSIAWIINISDSLSVLRKRITRREDLLWDVLLVIIHMLMIFFSIQKIISMVPNLIVIIMEPPASCFWKVEIRVLICWLDLWLPSIWIYVSIRIVNDSLDFRISFLCVYIAHSFIFSMKVVRRLKKLRLALVKSIRGV